MNRRYGALSSSVDPQKLAATVTGVLKVAAGALVYFGLASQLDADTLIAQVSALVSLGFTAWGLIESVYGILRKMLVAYSTR